MMTAMTKFVMSAVFGLTMFAAGDAGAARDDGPRHEARGGKMCEKIGCTDAQKAQLKQMQHGLVDRTIQPEVVHTQADTGQRVRHVAAGWSVTFGRR